MGYLLKMLLLIIPTLILAALIRLRDWLDGQ